MGVLAHMVQASRTKILKFARALKQWIVDINTHTEQICVINTCDVITPFLQLPEHAIVTII